MFAGKSLAEIAAHLVANPGDAPAAHAELSARVARAGKSAKSAQAALDRMAAGESVAFPAKAPKAPKAEHPQVTLARTNVGAARRLPPTSPAVRGAVTQAQACKLAADLLRSHGYAVPRALSTLAKGRILAARA